MKDFLGATATSRASTRLVSKTSFSGAGSGVTAGGNTLDSTKKSGSRILLPVASSTCGSSTFLISCRFYPLFITQFMGATNDNFLKNAMLIMVTYQLGASETEIGKISNIAAGLFILPFFIFSTIAGQLADKFDKSIYIRYVKWCEFFLMIAALLGFILKDLPLLLFVLFLMGTQSAFFGPAKYSLLPRLLKKDELLAGNAWIGGGTYIAILIGTLSGGIIVTLPGGNWLAGVILIIIALLGVVASYKIPLTPPEVVDLRVDWRLIRQTCVIMGDAVWHQKKIRYSVVSLSIFWMAGTFYLTQLPLITKVHLGGNEYVCTGFFALFSIGVACGAWLSNKLLEGEVRITWYQAAGIIGMAFCTFDLSWICYSVPVRTELLPIEELFKEVVFYRANIDLFVLSVCGGAWSVPMQAYMQKESRPELMARVISGNNILNSFTMAGGSILAAALLEKGIATYWLFVGMAIILLCTAVYSIVKFDMLSKQKKAGT